MYPGHYAELHPDRPAFVMASTGESVTYREFEERANRLAHLLRDHGLEREDHYSIFMENNDRYLEACSAGHRIGQYYTCINSYLTAEEVAYIVASAVFYYPLTDNAMCSDNKTSANMSAFAVAFASKLKCSANMNRPGRFSRMRSLKRFQ